MALDDNGANVLRPWAQKTSVQDTGFTVENSAVIETFLSGTGLACYPHLKLPPLFGYFTAPSVRLGDETVCSYKLQFGSSGKAKSHRGKTLKAMG
jgi:hypothetical protein